MINKNKIIGCLAEWSKAVALGAIPKGRGFKSHSSHFLQCVNMELLIILTLKNLREKKLGKALHEISL